MILRRFMQHVKEQNWFAVGLDVIVVIIGIFLGLQVQAWYEKREEIRQLSIATDRFDIELRQNLEYLRETVKTEEQTKNLIHDGLKLLSSCANDLKETELDTFNNILLVTSSSTNIIISMEAFNNLQTTTSYGSLIDEDTIRTLDSYNNLVERVKREIDGTEQSAWDNALFRLQDVTFKEFDYEGESYMEPIFRISASIHCDNVDLEKALYDFYSFVTTKISRINSLINQTENTLDVIR